MKTEKSKQHQKMTEKQESGHEKSEINDKTDQMFVDDQPTKSRSIKPNNIPTSLLILAFILANLQVSNGIKCSKSSDIKWISKKTNKPVGCTPCHPCLPSREFSIPCGTEAYVGETIAECIPCPSGKYSDGFNTKPCVACTVCSNKIVKQNCTPSSNSVCGDCLPGHYLEKNSFACTKCAKCCYDGQDEAHASCSAVGLCKPRPFGCPVVPTTKSVPTSSNITASTLSGKPHKQSTLWTLPNTKSATAPKVTSEALRSINSSGTGQSDAGTTNMTKLEYILSSAAHARQSAQNLEFASTQNPWFIVFLVIIAVIITILIIVVVILTIKFRKLKKSTRNAVTAYEPVSQDPSTILQMEMQEVVNPEPPVSHEDPSTSQMERGEVVNPEPHVSHEDPSTSQIERGEVVNPEPHVSHEDPSTSQMERGEVVNPEPHVSHEDPSTSQMERGEVVNCTAQEPIKHEDPSASQMERGDGGVEHTAYEPLSQDPSTSQLMEMGEENLKTLEELLDKNFDVVDKLCKILRKEDERFFDFERVASVWEIPGDDVRCINNEIHARNGSPVRKLLDVLCSQRLCTTVRQLADSIKDINSEAYEILKPHFLKPIEKTYLKELH